ncbi:cellulose synthase catalytic subunit (UDP-forming) [Pseudooceanicola sediminis]|uniref:Cellulose synthase catalytic subunit [UDP-forming] n=1 Tax=Pseudooceanicola sediminis TaxID=2211117 RepID=A0A399J2J0_9RHOB|nr:UDP-forming cellulose synthase catalytic subunit [Pseudooceanicola sediminis]KAA2312093.1 UDP-forming cellulose synthase catalytic subunit [Puniceibacterium sp. HSS470]RII38102.1 cellulose synthase catalytic subunit (UDP-forming) [Pseudooceanicola sediminis]|tara:strand:+ start:22581 stop:24923 length:2343 start_codon:yes stop_codon:yes gene_type:complete
MKGNFLFGKTRNTPLMVLWCLMMIPIAVLVSVPTSTSGQAFLGIIAVILVALLKPFSRYMVPRFLLLAVSTVLVMRYWLWRLLETLPDAAISLSFIIAVLLFMVETYSILVFMLNAFISADPTQRRFPPQVPPEDLPTVDILIPSYNEPIEMLSITLAAAKNMIYPVEKRTVVLCDDGGTDQRCESSDPELAAASRKRRADLQRLCRQLGVKYSTRARNENAKAGNMSAALEDLTGDIVVVFDADHVPSRDFLARTVGYFVDDPKLFLVQTPHFFINQDPIQRNLGLSRECPPENEMFYSQIHRGLDRWGGAFFCGSAALLRRTALDSVGGFAGETITEDAETALEIHSRGWKSLYLNRAMIAGLQPETFASFIQQRGRWATGMMQMLLLKNPLFRKGLRLPQRLCYINSMSFWLFPLIRLTYLVVPLVYLFFGIEIFVATFPDVMAYMLSYLAVSFLVQNALYSRYRWPLISEIYEIAQAPYLFRAVLKTVLRPRAAKFVVTAKDETLEQDYISQIHWPLTALWLLMLSGVLALIARWLMFPGDRVVLAVVGGWAVFNFMLVSVSYRAVAEKQQRRSSPRVEMNAPGTMWVGEGEEAVAAPIRILDASTRGARLLIEETSKKAVSAQHLKGTKIYFRPQFSESPHLETKVRAQVRSVQSSPRGQILGLLLEADQNLKVQETVAYLIFGDSENWRRIRGSTEGGKGMLAGFGYALMLFVRGFPALMSDLAKEPARLAAAQNAAPTDKKSAHLLAFGVNLEDPVDAPPPDPVRDTSIGGAA